MSKVVQWKRGNTSATSSYTGAEGEITVDTENWSLQVHDGVTAGGYTIASSNSETTFGAITVTGNANIAGRTSTGSLRVGTNIGVDQAQFVINPAADIVSITTAGRGDGNVSMTISANSSSSIALRADSGKMSFGNATPFGNTSGYTFNFGGNINADEYYADPNLTGYSFSTPLGTTGLSYVQNQDGTNSLQLQHEGTYAAKFTDNGASLIDGNLTVSSQDAYGIQFPDAPVKAFSNVDSYSQFVQQNLNNGTGASSDFVATSDDGTDSVYYIDMGINSSTFAQDYWFPGSNGAHTGYLYVAGYDAAGPSTGNVGNLIIGSTNGVVKTFVGNTTDANVVTTVSEGLLTVAGNVTAGNLIATTRTYANTAIFGYGTDGSGLIGAPIYISGNSTQSLIGTNGIAGNVASSLTVKTLNSNISLQITGAGKTWTFDTAGNLTAAGTILGNLRTNETIIALGDRAGSSNQGNLSVAIGSQAGQTDQGAQSVAVGNGAGATSQAAGATAIGALAGSVNQGLRAVAIGTLAGSSGQGEYAVAIGNFAGGTNQANNSIILNATGLSLDASTSGFFVAPIAANTAGNVVTYNTSTKELTYSNTISINGNISITRDGTATFTSSSGYAYITGDNGIDLSHIPTSGLYTDIHSTLVVEDNNILLSAQDQILGYRSRISVSSEVLELEANSTIRITAPNVSIGNINTSGNLITANTYVPSANNSAGSAGQITWDGDYVYVCVATDTWKRANLSTW